MKAILRPGDADANLQLGGKARSLASLGEADLPIPAWFVVAPDAFDAVLAESGLGALEESGGGPISEVLARIRPSRETCLELAQALSDLCPAGEAVAVRSSAADEDDVRYSFAGQFESFLFVPPSQVADRVAEVWRSAFGERVLTYRREHGLPPATRPPAVLVQRMVDADCSGVAFGADPVSGRRDVAVVAAVYGLGTLLVSGESDADTYHVDREGRIIKREIACKRMAHRWAARAEGGVHSVEITAEDATRPVLSDDQVRAVADLVRRTGRHFGRPQDIEWAIEGSRLYLLQSRPITSLRDIGDPAGVRALWDNSNIAESYRGVTTPLTFSFALRAYDAVYREFCRLMGVSRTAIAVHDDVFRHMLGLIRGRIYYNLLSWYRLLALLPGYAVNRRFMEQMMGVRERLPVGVLAERPRPGWRDRALDALRLIRAFVGLLAAHLLLPRRIAQFYRRLNETLRLGAAHLEDMRPDELVACYRDLERRLLTRWDAPIINDFFAMVYHGTLRRLTERWCGDREGGWSNELLCGEGGMISAEPATRMREIARIAAGAPELVTLLCSGSRTEIVRAMDRSPRVAAQYRAYLEKFGDRCLDELKLESPTLADDPLMLLRSVGQLAKALRPAATAGATSETPHASPRQRAERQVDQALRGHPFRRVVFGWVLRHARARVRERENLRFERTRAFGLARRIFLELGRRFYALDALDTPRDIFYLEVDEIFGFIDGTTTCADLKGLITVRKSEFERYKAGDPLADRFETCGVVHQGNTFGGTVVTEVASGNSRIGIPCCPGTARGRARVVFDPRTAVLQAGDILVAEHTDPGWIMLFPLASGLAVEHGSLLSHSAIVAREMGIPAVVSLAGLTSWLKDGDWVELDGSTGVVRRLDAPLGDVGGGE